VQPPWETLSERVTCVLGANPSEMTLNGTNCYLVGTGQKRLLVDAADKHIGREAFHRNLADAMEAVGCTGLSGIVVTHMHSDHYGGVEALQKLYGPVPVYMSAISILSPSMPKSFVEIEERGYLGAFVNAETQQLHYNPYRDPPPKATELPFSKMADMDFAFMFEGMGKGKGKGAKDKTAEKTKGKGEKAKGAEKKQGKGGGKSMSGLMQGKGGGVSVDPPREDHLFVSYMMMWMFDAKRFREQLRSGEFEWQRLEHEGLIRTEGATLRCLHGPGHAEDHFVFFLQEESALLSGDHVLGHGTTFVTDMYDYMQTLSGMLALQPARLYPGHGPWIADGVGLLTRYSAHRSARLDQVWETVHAIGRPFDARELARQLYLETPKDRMDSAADNVERILRQLVREGRLAMLGLREESMGEAHWNTSSLVPMEAPSSYKVWQLPAGVYFSSLEEHCQELVAPLHSATKSRL